MGKIKKAARQYPFRVEPSPSGGWTIWFPDLPGCSSWALDWESIGVMAHEVVEGWLESERRRKHPIPEPSAKTDNLWPRSAYHVMVGDYGPAIGVPDMAKIIGVSERRLRAIAQSRGVGRKFGNYLLFVKSDIERLRPLASGRPRTMALAAD
jgi:predicted RNase H-like HicB family nuclease